MPTIYPTTAEVQAKCTALGFTAPSDAESILNAVVADFENMTGYRPFLADAGDTTWTFDPPYKAKDLTLELGGAFISITTVSIGEVELTTDDYDLMPLNAGDESMGYEELRFRNHPGDVKASVEIVGRRGLYTSIPYDVFQALLDEAAGRCQVATSASGSADIQSVKQGAMSVTYGAPDSMGRTGFAKTAAAKFDATIRKYRRMVI